MHRVSIEGKSPYKESYKVTEKYLVMKLSKKLLNCSDQTWTGVFNFVWLFTFKMYRKELALICILIQEAYVKKFFSKIAFLHILNVYSHTKLNTSSCLITATCGWLTTPNIFQGLLTEKDSFWGDFPSILTLWLYEI